MLNRLQTFLRNVSGNVALTFALMTPLLVLLSGGVVDMGELAIRRTQIQDAADAAAVGSIAVKSEAYLKAGTLSSDGTFTTPDPQGSNIFYGNFQAAQSDTSVGSFSDTLTKTGQTVTSDVTVTSTFSTVFLKVFNMPSFPIVVTSHASATLPPYIDFYMLLDNTPSMGVGATSTDINNLIALTSTKTDGNSNSCAFACHELDKPAPGTKGANANTIDNYWTAKNNGVNTRIDVVRSATQALTSTASSTATANGVPCEFRMAVYTFGQTAQTNALTPVIQSPSYNLLSASSAQTCTSKPSDPSVYDNAKSVDLMTSTAPGDNNDDDTVFTSVMGGLYSGGYAIAAPQKNAGATPTNPQKVVFFVSDGMTDAPNGQGGGRPANTTFGPVDQAACTNLKNEGVMVAVLYTEYLPLPSNGFFNAYIAKYLSPTDQIAAAMQNCASPGFYFKVSTNQDITSAMNALFQKVVSVVRISS